MRLPLLAVCALLAACGGDPVAAMYDDYLTRLERVSQVDRPPDALTTESRPYPRGRLRQMAVPEVGGSLLDIFRLRRCGIAELVAERNSILGRHADTAARLAISGRIAQRLRSCREELADDEDEQALAQRIDEILDAKAAELEALTWNAALGSAAMARWWSPAADRLDPQRADMPGDALTQLTRAVDAATAGDREAADAAFSAAYQQLERQRYGGAWMHAAQSSIAGLHGATDMLRATDVDRLCPQQRPTPRARTLHTILEQRYFARIQPLLSELDRAMATMQDALEALWPGAAHAPDAVAAFRARSWGPGDDGMHARLSQAARAHAAAWGRILDHCGMPLGAGR